MRLTTATSTALSQKVPLVVLLVGSSRVGKLPAGTLAARAGKLLASKAFGAGTKDTLLLHAEDARGPRAMLLVGMGKRAQVTADALREAGRRVGARAAALKARKLVVAAGPGVELDRSGLAALGEGLVLSSYRYPLKQAATTPPTSAALVSSVRGAQAVLDQARYLAEGANLARELGDLPGNVATPSYLKKAAQSVCRKGQLRFKSYDKKALKQMKMGGILAVSQGSVEPPFLLEMEYKPARPKHTVCVVGKGLTFDSGGISIKPAAQMEDMKYDMCGAAATIGLMAAIAASRPKHVRVVGIVGTTENMGGAAAYKPGDVVTTAAGISIEVINTDAEGRVVLADALHHAKRFKPDAVIDMATLTGAIVVALGHEAAGLFCPDDRLARRLEQAAASSGEKLWRMPTYEAYDEAIKSTWGDIKNSAGREAGSCTAAAFLARFTKGLTHAHLDIAGTAWTSKSKGATGFGVRLLHEALSNWS